MRSEDFGAFVPRGRSRIEPLASGPLDGLDFAVKDLIDVEGLITGGGNPDWAARQQPAIRSATAVTRLLAAGATFIGKTVTDELAFSLEGENTHYGTPLNPRAPDRLPGGSSSGSAVAVAAGLVDLALGTDTGGSIRVPASFCGVFGYRPSHGRVPMDGVIPFAPGFDTVGLFARDPETLQSGALALLDQDTPSTKIADLGFAADGLNLIDPESVKTFTAAARALGATDDISVFGGDAASFLECYRVLQGYQVAQSLGEFIRTKPNFGPTIAPRFASVLEITQEQIAHQQQKREAIRARLHDLLPPGRLLVMPAAPGIAPKRYLRGPAADAFYAAALTLNSVAGLAGLPVITMPLAQIDGHPLGLSVMAGPGEDEALLAFAAEAKVYPSMNETSRMERLHG